MPGRPPRAWHSSVCCCSKTATSSTAATLQRALRLLDDAAFAPSLAARLHLALAERAALTGTSGLVRRHLRRARRLYRLAPPPLPPPRDPRATRAGCPHRGSRGTPRRGRASLRPGPP